MIALDNRETSQMKVWLVFVLGGLDKFSGILNGILGKGETTSFNSLKYNLAGYFVISCPGGYHSGCPRFFYLGRYAFYDISPQNISYNCAVTINEYSVTNIDSVDL